MEQKVPAEVKVVDVMAISSVLDQFDSFNQNLKELTTKYNMADIIYHLKKAIRGETTFFRKRGIYQFYQEKLTGNIHDLPTDNNCNNTKGAII